MDAFTDLLDDGGFRTGLAFGLVGTVAVALGALVLRRTQPWAGLAFAAAAAAAMADRYEFGSDLVVGLGILAAGGLLTTGRHPLLRMAAAAPGAVVFVAAADLDRPGWLPVAVGLAIVVGGALAADADERARPTGLAPVMLAASAFGVYFTTPDTEHAMVLVGVAVAIALVGFPRPLGSLGAAGATPAVAVLAWTVAVDGASRPGSVVGGLACLGMFVVEPVVRPFLPPTAGPRPRDRGREGGDGLRWAATVGALHVALVAVCSRVAGLREAAAPALAIAVVAHAAAAALLAAAARPDRQQRATERTT